jgi:hypothetical protein
VRELWIDVRRRPHNVSHFCADGETESEVSMREFVLEVWSFMSERKKFWMLPIVICLLLLGSLIVLTSGSAVAPFIYTLF